MPPNHGDDGLLAAPETRRHPRVGVLVRSHYPDSRYAARLLEELPERAGHLAQGPHLAGRSVIADALRHIDDGECVIDPTIVIAAGRAQARRGPSTC